MIIPDVDMTTATRAEIVAAYVRMGYAREDAEVKADVLAGASPDIPVT